MVFRLLKLSIHTQFARISFSATCRLIYPAAFFLLRTTDDVKREWVYTNLFQYTPSPQLTQSSVIFVKGPFNGLLFI